MAIREEILQISESRREIIEKWFYTRLPSTQWTWGRLWDNLWSQQGGQCPLHFHKSHLDSKQLSRKLFTSHFTCHCCIMLLPPFFLLPPLLSFNLTFLYSDSTWRNACSSLLPSHICSGSTSYPEYSSPPPTNNQLLSYPPSLSLNPFFHEIFFGSPVQINFSPFRSPNTLFRPIGPKMNLSFSLSHPHAPAPHHHSPSISLAPLLDLYAPYGQ